MNENPTETGPETEAETGSTEKMPDLVAEAINKLRKELNPSSRPPSFGQVHSTSTGGHGWGE